MPGRPIDKILHQLRRVRRTGNGRWMASSPTREDKSPSLSIRELDDGRVLLHDFGGDSVEDIVASLGLTLEDLFPDGETRSTAPQRRIAPAQDLLDAAAYHATIIALIVCDISAGEALTDDNKNRLLYSAGVLNNLAEAQINAR